MRPTFLRYLPLIFVAYTANAQTGSLILDEIRNVAEGYRWHVGPLLVTPRLAVGGGYDSNGLFTVLDPTPDLYLNGILAAQVAVPVGRKALFNFSQSFRPVYYRELTQRRDIASATRADVNLGGKSLLLRVSGERSSGKVPRIDQFDVFVDRVGDRFTSSLTMALGRRQRLSFAYDDYRVVEEFVGGVEAVVLPEPIRRREVTYDLNLTRRMTEQTSALINAQYRDYGFNQDQTSSDARSYRVVAGLTSSPTGRLRGQGTLGYNNIENEYDGLVGNINFIFNANSTVGIQAIYSRDAFPAGLLGNRFRIQQRYGGGLLFYMSRRSVIRARAIWGTNGYPQPVTFLDLEGETARESISDNVLQYSVTYERRLKLPWEFRLGAFYLRRFSNVESLNRDRLYFNITMTAEY